MNGLVLPNITQGKNSENRSFNTNLGYETISSFGSKNMEFRLNFLTNQNFFYTVQFEKYYLKKGETIKVQNLNISGIVHGIPKCFEMIYSTDFEP